MRSEAPLQNNIPGAVDNPPNPLGNSDIESVSVLKRHSVFSPPPKDNKKPFPHQALALKTYDTLCCSLERISDKVDSILYLDILLELLTLLVSSLEHLPGALIYALNDLGLTNVDRLLDILYERNSVVDYKLYSSPRDLHSEKEVLVKVIRTIYKARYEELEHGVELATNFLTLYANGE